jgi:hypothetical protein
MPVDSGRPNLRNLHRSRRGAICIICTHTDASISSKSSSILEAAQTFLALQRDLTTGLSEGKINRDVKQQEGRRKEDLFVVACQIWFSLSILHELDTKKHKNKKITFILCKQQALVLSTCMNDYMTWRLCDEILKPTVHEQKHDALPSVWHTTNEQ